MAANPPKPVHPYCTTCGEFTSVPLNPLLTGRRFECPSIANTFEEGVHVAAVGDVKAARWWLRCQRNLYRYLPVRNRLLSLRRSSSPGPAIIVVILLLAVAFFLATSPPLLARWLARIIAALIVLDILAYNTAVVFVSQKPRNILRTICFAILAVLQLTAAFAVLYLSPTTPLFEKPGVIGAVSLRPLEAWYFSVVTFGTVGFGDIHPLMTEPNVGKVEAAIIAEILTGVYFLIGILASFVSWAASGTSLGSLSDLISESKKLDDDTAQYGKAATPIE
jgi:hypothetical protein